MCIRKREKKERILEYRIKEGSKVDERRRREEGTEMVHVKMHLFHQNDRVKRIKKKEFPEHKMG